MSCNSYQRKQFKEYSNLQLITDNEICSPKSNVLPKLFQFKLYITTVFRSFANAASSVLLQSFNSSGKVTFVLTFLKYQRRS